MQCQRRRRGGADRVSDMFSRVMIKLTNGKWVFHSPCSAVLHQCCVRFFCHNSAPEIPHTHHVAPMLATEHPQKEAILQTLRRLAVSNEFKNATVASSDIMALSDALTRLGLGKHAIEFVGKGKVLPLAQKIQLLVSEEVASSDLKTLLKRRAFLGITLEKFIAVFNLSKTYFSTGEYAAKLLAHHPGLFLQSLEHVERKFKYLNDLQLGEKARLRIVVRSGGVLSLKEDSLKKKFSFWQEIGLSVNSRDRMLCRFPQILRQSVEASLQPKLDFLKSTGLDRETLLKSIATHPEIFGQSKKNIAVKFDIFRQLGFTNQECGRAICSLAQCSSQSIRSRFDTLRSQGFSDQETSLMLRKYPFIIGKSLKDIKKTMDYLVNVQNRGLKEILTFPACLGYSLEKRIIPRFDILREMDVLRKYCMSKILATSREKFMKQYKIPQSVKIIS